MKNYFTDEQLQKMINSVELKGRGVIHTDYCDGITREDLLAIMNLAVSTAIGEPVCHVADFTIDSIVDNPEDGLCMVKTKRYPYEIPLYRIAALESPQSVCQDPKSDETNG
jgi:hypothetical protein